MLRRLAAFATVLVLCGCGGSTTPAKNAPALTETPAPAALPATALLQNLLKSTADAYLAALLRGNALGVSVYLAGDCRAAAGNPANTAGTVKTAAAGATVTVAAVDVQGNTGAITAYTYSANASAGLKHLIESAAPGRHPWVYVNREWSLSCGPAAPSH